MWVHVIDNIHTPHHFHWVVPCTDWVLLSARCACHQLPDRRSSCPLPLDKLRGSSGKRSPEPPKNMGFNQQKKVYNGISWETMIYTHIYIISYIYIYNIYIFTHTPSCMAIHKQLQGNSSAKAIGFFSSIPFELDTE